MLLFEELLTPGKVFYHEILGSVVGIVPYPMDESVGAM